MAGTSRSAGRTLVVFGIGVAVLFGLVALAGSWKPALGLDLQGGQRITLRAADDDVSSEALDEAADIVNRRVNGSGVAEADVTTQGDTNIVVEIPGESNQALVEVVRRQAQLRFRLVACSTVRQGPCAGAQEPAPGDQAPDGQNPDGQNPDGQNPDGQNPDDPTGSANRPAPALAADDETTPTEDPTGSPQDGTQEGGRQAPADVEEALAFKDAPGQPSITAFSQATCPLEERPDDGPGEPLVTCDDDGVKYLLSPSVVEGTQLTSAEAGQDARAIDWQVQLGLDDAGARAFGTVSQALVNGRQQFAIVLDGTVISAPTMEAVITDGRASISGDFNEQTATDLATSLKFGALPVAFEDDPKNDTIGPSLAGNQLSAGIWAGVVGLLVVMLYCLLYYRGLGTVVIASLLTAGVITYGMVLLLSQGAGFTVSLPGIAGLIVAVGITADSFIVFFERIRDEMREGKSMRVAVEAGWLRARNTCLAADTVSLLAALVLYIFAIDEVRGFAFTLGLVTLIDLVVFFFFTKPLVTWLGRFAFFHRGHRLSGLDAENLGLDRLPGVAAGGAR
ncbi:protein translocase subunit SecD [Nocardioides donggukensis]|uniref:Protein translocase subunit SecD n=1 Tax=Nocardioides donggukensis TaxID=2774019 RepID=A0A927Q2L5_9ACTN|nr:protein translocase subunit SecD [Nocardioides donggukensis]MBD8869776.1 protein translocase subunit SecD [Nocardioides donggukensis]